VNGLLFQRLPLRTFPGNSPDKGDVFENEANSCNMQVFALPPGQTLWLESVVGTPFVDVFVQPEHHLDSQREFYTFVGRVEHMAIGWLTLL